MPGEGPGEVVVSVGDRPRGDDRGPVRVRRGRLDDGLVPLAGVDEPEHAERAEPRPARRLLRGHDDRQRQRQRQRHRVGRAERAGLVGLVPRGHDDRVGGRDHAPVPGGAAGVAGRVGVGAGQVVQGHDQRPGQDPRLLDEGVGGRGDIGAPERVGELGVGEVGLAGADRDDTLGSHRGGDGSGVPDHAVPGRAGRDDPHGDGHRVTPARTRRYSRAWASATSARRRSRSSGSARQPGRVRCASATAAPSEARSGPSSVRA